MRLDVVAGAVVGAVTVFAVAGAGRCLDDAAERAAVYGIPLTEAPWSPDACAAIASEERMALTAKRAGARKSAYMADLARRADGERYGGEVERVISDAWDADADPDVEYSRCLVRFLTRPQQGDDQDPKPTPGAATWNS